VHNKQVILDSRIHDLKKLAFDSLRILGLITFMLWFFTACGPHDDRGKISPQDNPQRTDTPPVDPLTNDPFVLGIYMTKPERSRFAPPALTTRTEAISANGEIEPKSGPISVRHGAISTEQNASQRARLERAPMLGFVHVGCEPADLDRFFAGSLIGPRDLEHAVGFSARQFDVLAAAEEPFPFNALALCGDIDLRQPLRVLARRLILSNASIKVENTSRAHQMVVGALSLVGQTVIDLGLIPISQNRADAIHILGEPKTYVQIGDSIVDQSHTTVLPPASLDVRAHAGAKEIQTADVGP
jgi:hypothetical protein